MSIWDNYTADAVESSGQDFADIIQPGTHRVQVVAFSEDAIKNCSIVTFRNKSGAEIRDYFYATPAALWKVKALGHALGVDKTKPPASWFNERGLLRKVVEITVVAETYEGKTRNKVKSYAVAAAPVGSSAEPVAAPPPVDNVVSADDIPF